MRRVVRSSFSASLHPILFLLGASAMLVALACTESGPTSPPSPLEGLNQGASRDSAGNSPPPAPTLGTPGYVHGTVLGPSAPGAGNDSLATAPRVANARIAAFRVTGGTASSPTLGPEAAAAFTGADGKFTLPTVPGGEYVVTITPPAGSTYGGVWVTVTIHDQSHTFPWWVVLWRK